MLNIKAIVGVEGVSKEENALAQKVGQFFSYLVLLALLVVVVQLVIDSADRSKDSIWISAVVWFVFTAELVVNLILVDNRWRYLKHNWLNVLIIILVFPWIDYGGDWAAIFRAFRLLLFLRIMVDGFWDITALLRRNNFGVILLVAFIFIVISGAIVSVLEPEIDFREGIWYSLVTVTTVGYGDIVPETEHGRLFGAVLIVFGVALFSLVTANISAFLIGSEQKRREQDILQSVREMQAHLNAQTKLNEVHLTRLMTEMAERVEDLENRIRSSNSDRVEKGLHELEAKFEQESQKTLAEMKGLIAQIKFMEKGESDPK